MTDGVMLYQFDAPHDAHAAFADSLGLDMMHFERGNESERQPTNEQSIPKRAKVGIEASAYDYVVGEGSVTIQNLLVSGLNPTTKTILLVADETFIRVDDRVWKVLGPIASRILDGAVCVSELAEEWMNQYVDVPTRIVHPPISDEKYELLDGVKSDYDVGNRPNIVTTAIVSDSHALWKKNTDSLVEATRGYADLTILGSGHDNFDYHTEDHVTALGFASLDKMKEVYSNADLFVLPSRGDTFPVSTLEAMHAGIPTTVSESTGTKSVVNSVDEDFVTGIHPDEIRQTIMETIDMDTTERKAVALEQRERVKELTEANQKAAFEEAVGDLL